MLFSAALEQVVIGNRDLHADGFSCLGTIFTAYYGGFLQVFQYDIGWKRINGLDIAKLFQYSEHLVQVVSKKWIEIYIIFMLMKSQKMIV